MGPIDNVALSSLIGDIYECALDRTRWGPTLERICHTVDACAASVISHGMRSVSLEYNWGASIESFKLYAEKYAALNPLATIGWHFAVDDPITLARRMDPNDLRQTIFYREFLAPLNWFDFSAVFLEQSATQVSMMNSTRREGQSPPGERETALIGFLAPQIRRAMIFRGFVERDAARATDLAAALDLVQIPILLLDASGHCVEANASAERFLAETDMLRLEQGAIRAQDHDLDARIASAIAAGNADIERIDTQPLSIAFTQSDGRRFAGHVLPLAGGLQHRIGGQSRARSALFIQAVGDLLPLPGEVLVRLYGLTHAETRLIGLLGRDFSLDDTAAALGIAMSTARTHLQRIFEKTGTNRQSELIKLVLSALPGPPA